MMDFITEDVDPILAEPMLCLKALVEALPGTTQQKKFQEYEVHTRYLQPFFQSVMRITE